MVAPCPRPPCTAVVSCTAVVPCVRGTVVRCLRPKREVRAGRTGPAEREKRERRGAVVVWCVIVGYVCVCVVLVVWFDLIGV